MRKKLKESENKRMTFLADFERYGTKTGWNGYQEKTILLKNIRRIENSQLMTDHIWFSLTKGFEKLGELKEGDIIKFDARIKKYSKGYNGYREEVRWERPSEIDYKLSHPTKILKNLDFKEIF